MTDISKSTVSKLCKDIDERVLVFLKRPLTGERPYLWLDATNLKVREGGRIFVQHRRRPRRARLRVRG
jgi:Transposase and inactivated derivatives